MRRTAVAALAAALLASAVAPAQGQDDLSRALDRFAALWERGDAVALAGYGAGRGIELEVQGETLGRVSGRKAAAALRQLFANQETVSVRASMTSRVTGTDHTAFGELTWETRPRGSMVPTRVTVFLGLVREGSVWRVTQIRILR